MRGLWLNRHRACVDDDDDHANRRNTCKMIGCPPRNLLLMTSLTRATHLHMFCSVASERMAMVHSQSVDNSGI